MIIDNLVLSLGKLEKSINKGKRKMYTIIYVLTTLPMPFKCTSLSHLHNSKYMSCLI